MFTKNIMIALGIIIAVATWSTASSAKSCWPYGKITSAEGKAYSKDTAKKYARIKWRIKVRSIATLGIAYDNWGIAVERSYSCKKKYGKHRCRAIARPCRP